MPDNYRYSFSGTDVTNICWFSLLRDGQLFTSSAVNLESLTAISISVHESKIPIRALGHRSVKGYTGALRTVGGTMILTAINDHPLKQLFNAYAEIREEVGSWLYSIDQDRDGSGFVAGKSGERKNILPTHLPPFNIGLTAVTEIFDPRADTTAVTLPNQQVILLGVQLIDDGMVLSTNNPLSENTFTFVAEDYVVLHQQESLLAIALGLAPNKNIGELFIPGLDLDKQQIWIQNEGLQHKPGEVNIDYITDENGDTIGLTTSSSWLDDIKEPVSKFNVRRVTF